ncbi:MAG TPA: response regulator transcription factor [Bryobacteraceae bacterium]|nr:response regulator transcription factor [Bryobacteraceae bacterium]
MPELSEAIQIVLVEDHILLRGALAKTLAAEPDCAIAGECATVEEALRIVADTPVDIVLLDINLGSEQGGSFLNRAKESGYHGKVLVVTAGISEREAAWLLNCGCSGIFLKSEPLPGLVERIRSIVHGNSELDPRLVRAMISHAGAAQGVRKQLTARESRVLRCVCEGMANKEIADYMGISENTVKSFLQQLFAKTGVRTRARLVAAAIEQYWDQLDQS